jgi:hypothetical protein
MRLIDADEAVEQINEWLDQTGAIPLNTSYHFELLGCIEDCPTIDAVPVVRCGECANAKLIDKNESVYTCTHPQWTRRSHNDTFEESQLFHGLEGNDFCSYGAKMEVEP